MKSGLRLQMLVLLGLVLGLAFVPLYFAISTYIDVAIARTQSEAARDFARSTARWVSHAERPKIAQLGAALPQQSDAYHIRAVAIYAQDGTLQKTWEDGPGDAPLPNVFSGPGTRVLPPEGKHRHVIASERGQPWNATVLVEFEAADTGALNRLVALYMSLIGSALLVGVYFTVTVFIIRPLDQISTSAKNVASAGHRLRLPRTRSRELQALANNLQSMTKKLAQEEASLRSKVQELELARERLETAQAQLVRSERLASVGQLAAGLAHEIGNPITAMQGMQDLILDGGLDAEQQLDFTRRMRKETERISRIIRDLLDFARPKQAASGALVHGNVEAAINETITLVSPQPLLREVDLAVDVVVGLPEVTLDHGQLTQVVLNLLLNAAAACKEGGRVEVKADRLDQHVRLVVQDNGPGVQQDLVDRLFEPFVTSKDVGEGSGLGLSVCRGLVEAGGGSITLDTEYVDGARFVVLLEPVNTGAS